MEEKDGVVLGVILARGGSRRVYKKNIKLLGGKPLVAWTIEAAKNAKMLDYFLVSTNDEEITKISKDWGAPVPFKRPEKISEDVDSIQPTIHAIQKYESYLDSGRWDVSLETVAQHMIDYVVILQPTSPFRTSADIDECVRIAKTTGVDAVISFKKACESPYWMFTLKEYGHEMEPYTPEIELEGDNLVIQNLPTIFYPNGAVYVLRRDVALRGKIYEGNRIYGFIMPEERSIDLETECDFMHAEAMIPYLQQKDPHTIKSWVIS
jgi:CMP-N-acetylneuraminic acid synthetase